MARNSSLFVASHGKMLYIAGKTCSKGGGGVGIPALACAVVAALVLSGCAIFKGSSAGGDAGAVSLNEYIANTMPLPPGASGAPSAPAPVAGTDPAEDSMTEPQIDDHMFSPSGEPIIRPGYILRIAVAVGDKMEVNPLEVQVSAKTEITLPLIGKVDCAGLTVNGLRSRLTSRYGEFFRSPEVSADFVVHDPSTSPWGRVLVQGRVHQEGWVSIPATRYLMVSDAIQKAGGFGQFARKDNVRVSRRRKDGTIEFFKINLEEIGKKGKTENDMLLKSGDVVYVYESSI